MSYWYVDNTATGANNGGKDAGWTNAWETLAAVVWGGSGVIAGDTLWISGGTGSKTYLCTGNSSGTGEQLYVTASGSAGNLIYIKPGAAHPTLSSGHDGTVIFDSQNAYHQAIKAPSRHHVVIDGSDGVYSIVPVGQNSHRKFRIQNTYIQTGGYTGIEMPTCHDVKVLNLEIVTAPQGLVMIDIDQLTGYQSEIAGNYIHDIRQEAAIRITNSAVTNPRYDAVLVHDNEIQVNVKNSVGEGADGIQSTNGMTFYNNLIYSAKLGDSYVMVNAQHPDLLVPSGIYTKIYNNIIRNPGQCGIRGDESANPGGYLQIYNNIIEINSSSFDSGALTPFEISFHTTGSITDILFANNTIAGFGNTGDGLGGSLNIFNTPTVTNFVVRNNIFYEVGNATHQALRVVGIDSPTGTVDNNLMYKSASYGSTNIQYGSTDPYTQPTGYVGQPTFISYTRVTPNNNYHLSAGDTQARDKGVDLSSWGFTTDYDGDTRTATWDIGAYEYTGTGSKIIIHSHSAIT